MKRLIIAILLCLTASYASAYSLDDITDDEQYQLEVINRGRADPKLESARTMLDIDDGLITGTIGYSPKQPLMFDISLYTAAKNHCLDMDTRHYFNHTSLDGREFYTRIGNAGYSGYQLGENINTVSEPEWSYELFYIDNGVDSKGHRINMYNDQYSDVGISLCSTRTVHDFGGGAHYDTRITGVIYDDLDKNGIYTPGEGVNSVTINSTSTNYRAGGYSISVANNKNIDLVFKHPRLGSVTKTVIVGNLNVKVDVLASEFILPNADTCPSIFNGVELTLQCVNYLNINYSAKLAFLNNNFSLTEALPISTKVVPKGIANCAIYDIKTNIVDIPCVSVSSIKYWAKLSNVSPNIYKLLDYGVK